MIEMITPTATPTRALILVSSAKARDITPMVRAGRKIFMPIFSYCFLEYSFVGIVCFPTFTRLKMAGMIMMMTRVPETLVGSQWPRAHTIPKDVQNTNVP